MSASVAAGMGASCLGTPSGAARAPALVSRPAITAARQTGGCDLKGMGDVRAGAWNASRDGARAALLGVFQVIEATLCARAGAKAPAEAPRRRPWGQLRSACRAPAAGI